MSKGVRVGLDKLHYAIMTDETTEAYTAPKPWPGAITATVTPTTNSATLYADNQASEVATALGGIGVEIGIKDIPPEVQKDILGSTINEDGVLIDSKNDNPPYVAIGYRSLKSNGKYRYYWLYKGKFQVNEESFETKKDSPAFQTPTISAQFIPRDKDGHWRARVDEDATGIGAGVVSGWFTSVYEEAEV